MFTSQELKLNPLDLADCDLVFGAVVKFGGPGRLVRSHLLGMLEPTSILQVNRHTGSAPGVTPDRRQKPRVPRSFANGYPGIVPIQRAPAKRGASLVHALKQRLLVLNTDFGQVLIDSFLDLMVCRHFMLLAAFLMKPQPAPRSLVIEILSLERQDGADPGKTKKHGTEQTEGWEETFDI